MLCDTLCDMVGFITVILEGGILAEFAVISAPVGLSNETQIPMYWKGDAEGKGLTRNFSPAVPSGVFYSAEVQGCKGMGIKRNLK